MNLTNPVFTKNGDQTSYHVTHACSCGFVTKGEIQASDLFKWRQGATPATAFPYLSTTQNEALFITGICGFCWDNLFPDEAEDYDEQSFSVSDMYPEYDPQSDFFEREGRPMLPNEY